MDIVYYTVRPGNTLFGIAQFFQTTVNDILRYNNIADANRIYVGETLAIPAGTSQSPRTHIVHIHSQQPIIYHIAEWNH